MAAGLPIVATNVGDLPHLISTDSGILVSPQQPHALSQALMTLCDDAPRRRACGAAAKAHVMQHYDAGIWVKRLIAVYKDAQASAGLRR